MDWSGFLSSWETVAFVIARNSFYAATSSYMMDLEMSMIDNIVFFSPSFTYSFFLS